MTVIRVAGAVAPCHVQRAVWSNRKRWKGASVLTEARPGHGTDRVVGHFRDSNILRPERLAAIVGNGQALDGLLIHSVEPDDVNCSVGPHLYRRALASANGVVIIRRADGQGVAPSGATIRRTREHDLVAADGELRPGSLDVVA